MADDPIMLSPDEGVRATCRWLASRAHVRKTTVVAIDGGGGAGKTTLAGDIARALRDRPVAIVHVDDFYLPSTDRPPRNEHGTDVDFARLRGQLLDPLRLGRPARYQRYDWPSDALAEWHEVAPGGVVLLEGVGAAEQRNRDALDFIIWVECPAEVRLRRGLARDGEAARPLWEDKWLPAEETYLATQRPREAADLIVDGSDRA